VFAALAVGRLVEERTGWSIRRFVRTARRYRTVQIRAGQQLITAADPLPADLDAALTEIRQAGGGTNLSQVGSNGQTITHLTHDAFALVMRVRNVASGRSRSRSGCSSPTAEADDRMMWMELDKFLVEVPANGRSVVFRPDTEFAVVKKPAETDPQSVIDGEGDPNDPDYCDCGWPYTLLIPRGIAEGMAFRLVVFCTDANRDLVRPSGGCGSMSFCGAVDRYPDTRDMDYPYSRPFAGSIAATVLGLPSAAGRSLAIRHLE
jgi:hypothetical protein